MTSPEPAAPFRGSCPRVAQLDRLLADRHAQFDAPLRAAYAEHGSDFERLREGGRDPSRRRESAMALLRLRQHFAPSLERGTLIEEMGVHLDASQQAEARRLLGEYLDALVEEALRDAPPDGPAAISPRGRPPAQARGPMPDSAAGAYRQGPAQGPPPPSADRGRAERSVRLELFGQQIRRSLERQVRQAELVFEAYSTELDLTPEQAEKAKAIFQPLATARLTGQAPGRAATLEALAQFMQLLTPAQRPKALELLRQRSPREAR